MIKKNLKKSANNQHSARLGDRGEHAARSPRYYLIERKYSK